MKSSLWAMVTIGGPILPGVVLIFVMLSNCETVRKTAIACNPRRW